MNTEQNTQNVQHALRDVTRRLMAATVVAFDAADADVHEFRMLDAVASGAELPGRARQHVLEHLARAGFATSAEDGAWTLTEEGAARLETLRAIAAGVQATAFAGVDEAALAATLASIVENLGDTPEGVGRGFGFGFGRRFKRGFGGPFGPFAPFGRGGLGPDGRGGFGPDGRGGFGPDGFGREGIDPRAAWHDGFGLRGHGHHRGERDGEHRGDGRGRREERAFERGFRRGFDAHDAH